MALPKLVYTPVTSPRGKLVHAVAFSAYDGEAACGRRPKGGWRVALRPLGCPRCKNKIHRPVQSAAMTWGRAATR
jgi:hypothetical protein